MKPYLWKTRKFRLSFSWRRSFLWICTGFSK